MDGKSILLDGLKTKTCEIMSAYAMFSEKDQKVNCYRNDPCKTSEVTQQQAPQEQDRSTSSGIGSAVGGLFDFAPDASQGDDSEEESFRKRLQQKKKKKGRSM